MLTEIDWREVLTTEIGAESADRIGDCPVLGACKPQLANRGLLTEPGLGALLPFNVLVRRAPGATETTVEAIDAHTLSRSFGNPAIRGLASDADARLKAALDWLRTGWTRNGRAAP